VGCIICCVAGQSAKVISRQSKRDSAGQSEAKFDPTSLHLTAPFDTFDTAFWLHAGGLKLVSTERESLLGMVAADPFSRVSNGEENIDAVVRSWELAEGLSSDFVNRRRRARQVSYARCREE
jgi:hypothetical protein